MKTLEDIHTLDSQAKRLLLKLKDVISTLAPNAMLLLYGSAARGTRGPDSDYDVLMLVHQPLAGEELAAIQNAVYDIELEHEVIISLAVYTLDEWNGPLARISPYHQAVEEEAIRL